MGEFLRALLQGNRRNLAGEGVVRKVSSPLRVRVYLIFAMAGDSVPVGREHE